MYKTNLLTQLQTLQLTDNGDMQEHLTKMCEIKEQLTEMNCPVTNASFVSYLRTSLSLVPNYRTLLTTLNATAHKSGKKLTSTNLIWHLTKEANSLALEDSINKSNPAMMVATKSKDSGKGKGKSKGKEKMHCSNPNCNKNGHMIKNCFMKGGGKEKEAPEWFKKLAARQAASASAHVTKKGQDDDENYAMLTYDEPEDPTALIVTSDFRAEAHAISTDHGIILDTGASRHFSPDRSNLMNYREISPEPVRAADGCTFSGLGQGDLKVKLPNGDQRSTPVMLKNAYYSPNLAFTLISVSCANKAGFSFFIKGGNCIVRSPKSNVIGRIPPIRGLYHVGGSFNSSPAPSANVALKLCR